jgi:YidC/Oxa1 family membrane protein insertase
MSALYHAIIVNPLYNALIGLFAVAPWVDAGIAVVILTIIVRLILYPLSRKAVLTQVRMQEIAPELAKIKEKYKDNEEQARKTLELYKEKSVNPFSGVSVLLIQLPIIFALYRIFLHAGFPNVDSTLLYSFVHIPDHISIMFLGLFDITQKSVILALLAAASTYFQLKIATARAVPAKTEKGNFADDLSRSMQTQMKYIFPILVFFIAYKISGVIALYWLTSNLFTIGQEIVVRRKLKNEGITPAQV